MSRMSKHHEELTNGEGKCSVPMWGQGVPAGFCDKPAYGVRPECLQYRDRNTGKIYRTDGKYSGYIPGLACPAHGGPEKPIVYKQEFDG